MKCGTSETCMGCPIDPEILDLEIGDPKLVAMGEVAEDQSHVDMISRVGVEDGLFDKDVFPFDDRIHSVVAAALRKSVDACKPIVQS